MCDVQTIRPGTAAEGVNADRVAAVEALSSLGVGQLVLVALSLLATAALFVSGASTAEAQEMSATAQGPVCPLNVGELVLVSEVPETNLGASRLTCEYVPPVESSLDSVRVTLVWGTPGADPDSLPACGLEDQRETGNRGYVSSQTAAASITYTKLTRDLSLNLDPAFDRVVRDMLASVEPVAAPCAGPPTDLSQVEQGIPPVRPTLEELAFYNVALACEQSISGFDLNQPGRAWIVGKDFLNLKCLYTRAGVDPAEAGSQDQAEIDLSWTKLNGRNGRYCFDAANERETESAVFAVFYDGVHSAEVERSHPLEGDVIRTAFADAAARLHARAVPMSYVCPNFNEITFDSIPPYWQPVFGNMPPPASITLADEVSADDMAIEIAARAAAAGAETASPALESAGTPGVETLPAGPEVDQSSAGLPERLDAAPSRSPLWKVIGIAGLLLSVLGLVVAILLVRKSSRVRPKWDYARLGIAVVTIVFMTAVVGIDTPFLFIAVGIVAGAILGLLQGRNLEVTVTERGLYAARNIVAVVAFGVGLVIVQVAGLANRSGVVALGLGLSFLSAAMTAGIIAGRRKRLAALAGAGAVTIFGLLVVVSLVAYEPPSAEAQEASDDPVREVLVDMVDWDEIRVVGGLWAGDGKPMLTISVPRGLEAGPDPISNTIAWETGTTEFPRSYEITESYTFELDDEGSCCIVTIVADGTRTDSGREPSTHHAEAVVEIQPPGQGLFTSSLTPFGDPELFFGTDAEDPPCGRPVAEVGALGGAEWTKYTIDGNPTGGGGVELFLLTDCEVPGFTVSNALARAAPPPPPGAAERMQGDLGPCPVLQEIVGPIAEASGLDVGNTYTVGRLYGEPNTALCGGAGAISSVLGLGTFRPGGQQLVLSWSIATNDVDYEVARLDDINYDFINAKRQYGIYDEEACELDANGDIVAPAEGDECIRRQFFSVGSEVTIWTEYDHEGPSVEVRGRLGWGSYFLTCHHCEPNDPMLRNAIAAWHGVGAAAGAAASGGVAAAEAEEAEVQAGAVAGEADEEVPAGVVAGQGEETEGVEPPSAAGADTDNNDIDARDAAAAVGIALVGSAAMAASAAAESETPIRELTDAVRGRSRPAHPRGPGDGSEPMVEDVPPDLSTPDAATATSDGAEDRGFATDGVVTVGAEATVADEALSAEPAQPAAQSSSPLRPGFVDGPPSPEDGEVAIDYPEPTEIRESRRVNEVLGDLPPEVREEVEEVVRAGLESEAAAQALERGRQAIGEVDPSVERVSQAVAENPDVEEALSGLPEDVRRQVEADLVRELERERVEAASAAVRAALERQRAVVLVREAIDAGDAERVDQILDQVPDEVSSDVWQEAAAGRPPVNMGAAQQPGTGESAPVSLLPDPEDDIGAVVTENPTVDEVLEGLPPDVRTQVEERVRAELESELIQAARSRVRGAIGEVDPSVDDLSEALEDSDVQDALHRLHEQEGVAHDSGQAGGIRRQIDEGFVRELEQERLDAASAAVRAALERQRAIALVREAITAGDAERVDQILDQVPVEVSADVWQEATAGQDADLGAMRAGQIIEPDAEPVPVSLLPDPADEIRAVVVESPSVDEVLEGLPAEVRVQVQERVTSELEAELLDAARGRVRQSIGEVDPSVDDLSEVLREPEVEEALHRLHEQAGAEGDSGRATQMRREIDAGFVRELEQQRIEQAAAAARHAAELDRAEAAVRSAMEDRNFNRVQAILEGLDPDEAEAVAQTIEQSLPTNQR